MWVFSGVDLFRFRLAGSFYFLGFRFKLEVCVAIVSVFVGFLDAFSLEEVVRVELRVR